MRTIFPFSIRDLEELNGSIDETLSAEERDLSNYKIAYLPGAYSLGIGLTSRCNLNCPFCYYRERGHNTVSMLPIARLRDILTGLGQLRLISFSLEGEALLYPGLKDALDLASEHAEILQITTNGQLLDDGMADLLCGTPKLRSLILSIDSADPGAYAAMRCGGKLSTLERNIRNFQKRNTHIFTELYAIVTDRNIDTLHTLPEFAASLGIKLISFGKLREHGWSREHQIHGVTDRQMTDEMLRVIAEAQKEQVQVKLAPYFADRTVVEELREKTDPSYGLFIPPDRNFCDMPWSFTAILSDGRLFPCCGDFSPAEIEECSFDGIFNHKYLLLLRKLIKHRAVPEGCLECRNCRVSRSS